MMRTRRPGFILFPFLIPLALIAVSLTGCLSGPSEDKEEEVETTGAYTISDRVECDPEIISNCDEANRDPSIPYHVGPKVLAYKDFKQGPLSPNPAYGLWIKEVDRDVVVQDVTLLGFHEAIRIEQVECPECSIHLENITVRPDPEYAFEHQPFASISAEHANASIHIDHASLHLPPERVLEEPEQYLRSDPGDGILIKQSSGPVTIKNVRVHVPGPVDGRGIDVSVEGALHLEKTITENFTWDCIRVEAHSVVLRQIETSVCGNGVVASLDEEGFSHGSDREHIASLEKILVHDVQRVGIFLGGSRDIATCSPITTHELFDSEGPPVLIKEALAEKAGWTGLAVTMFTGTIESSAFIDNGHAWSTDSDVIEYNTGGIFNACSVLTVQNTIFEGNTRYGMLAGPYDDLRENWWGSEQGPTLDPWATGPRPPIVFGDRLGPQFHQHIPFLTERPDNALTGNPYHAHGGIDS